MRLGALVVVLLPLAAVAEMMSIEGRWLSGFRYDVDGRWVDGRIYDPNSGNTYKGTIQQVDANTLKLRGYIGISLFGRTEKWTRDDE